MGRGFDSCSRHHLPFRGHPVESTCFHKSLAKQAFSFHHTLRLSVDSLAARRLVAGGVDPSDERKAEKVSQGETLGKITEEWLALQAKTLAAVTCNKARWML